MESTVCIINQSGQDRKGQVEIRCLTMAKENKLKKGPNT